MSLDIIVLQMSYGTFAYLTYYQAAIPNIYLKFPAQHTNTMPRNFTSVRERLKQIPLEAQRLEATIR
jgi:hypothetical protein